MKYTVANLDPDIHPRDKQLVEILADAQADLIEEKCTAADQIIRFAGAADALIAAHARVDGPVIEKLECCKVIARPGSGTDNVDHDAATERGIVVVYVPDFCTEEVANHALMFVLACNKKLIRLDSVVRRGEWGFAHLAPIASLKGQVLGLVGFGRIARSLAGKAIALGMKAISHDPFVDSSMFDQLGVAACELEEVIVTSDYLSLHVPLTAETEGLIGVREISMMKATAFLINCARGGIVDEGALDSALRDKRIAGAALDCFAQEPPPPDHPLLKLDNVVFTPHSAAYSDEAIGYLRRKTYTQVAQVLSGRRPEFVRNPKVLEKVNLA